MSEMERNEAAHAHVVKPASPMLRSAKVVCQSGEYVCLVRDVSETGVLLSYLHDVPVEPRIMLALGNGQTYPIQRIWSGNEQAGYRFGGDVSIAEFLHESAPFNVRPVRLAIKATARVIDGSRSHGAQLLDLSSHGAKFECPTAMGEGRMISFQMHAMHPQLGQIVWHARDRHTVRYGLQFQHPLSLRELAQAALRMQPYGPCTPASSNPSATSYAFTGSIDPGPFGPGTPFTKVDAA